jgi:hypothetical protein
MTCLLPPTASRSAPCPADASCRSALDGAATEVTANAGEGMLTLHSVQPVVQGGSRHLGEYVSHISVAENSFTWRFQCSALPAGIPALAWHLDSLSEVVVMSSATTIAAMPNQGAAFAEHPRSPVLLT